MWPAQTCTKVIGNWNATSTSNASIGGYRCTYLNFHGFCVTLLLSETLLCFRQKQRYTKKHDLRRRRARQLRYIGPSAVEICGRLTKFPSSFTPSLLYYPPYPPLLSSPSTSALKSSPDGFQILKKLWTARSLSRASHISQASPDCTKST